MAFLTVRLNFLWLAMSLAINFMLLGTRTPDTAISHFKKVVHLQTMNQSTKIGLKIQSKSKWQNWIAIHIQIREKYWIDINPNPNPTHRKY